jgi:iron-sulfur cluster repair protein YtfE (RIC family)
MLQGDIGLGHPGLDINQIKKDLNLEQIQEKLRDLYKRQAFAYQTGNQQLISQIDMIIEVYTRAQLETLDEMFKPGGDGPNIDDKIDIS